MKVCVIGGAGYVGLITGLCLAETGHHVINVDVDHGRIYQLQAGICYVYEEGIEPLLRRNLDGGRLKFSTNLSLAVESSDVIFIAVDTPSQEDGQADVSQIVMVAESLVGNIYGYKVLVIKSTVPAGTVELMQNILGRDKHEGEDFDIVVNPEFLREGKGLALRQSRRKSAQVSGSENLPTAADRTYARGKRQAFLALSSATAKSGSSYPDPQR